MAKLTSFRNIVVRLYISEMNRIIRVLQAALQTSLQTQDVVINHERTVKICQNV